MSNDENHVDGYFVKSLGRLEKTVDRLDEKTDTIDKTLAVLSAAFRDHFKQDEKMYDEFAKMVVILQNNTDDMKHHIRRTDEVQNTNTMLHEIVMNLMKRLDPIERDILKKQAVRDFLIEMASKWSKILAVLATVGSLVYYIIRIKVGS